MMMMMMVMMMMKRVQMVPLDSIPKVIFESCAVDVDGGDAVINTKGILMQ